MKKQLQNQTKFEANPMSDKELYAMMRINFKTNAECWEAVQEAQDAYRYLCRQAILEEMAEERNDRDNYDNYYAA